MEAKATAKYVSMTPRKVRFVMDTIRGKYATDAAAQLKFTPNHAAGEILKVLNSAVANAENNLGLNPDVLKVTRCFVDVGPTLKRVQPRAQGRAYRILKRTSHITVVVEETEPKPRKTGKTGPKTKKPPLRAAMPTPAAAAPAVDETPTPVEAVEERDEQVTATATATESAPTTGSPADEAIAQDATVTTDETKAE